MTEHLCSPHDSNRLVFLLSTLCEGDVLYGERKVYSSAEGGNVTIRCSLSANTQNRKFLCREECKKTLIETTTVGAKSGRYSIEYESSSFFNVTIAELNKSDSGLYRCGVASQVSKNTCQGFEISVTSGEFQIKVIKVTPQAAMSTLTQILYFAVILLTLKHQSIMFNRVAQLLHWHMSSVFVQFFSLPLPVESDRGQTNKTENVNERFDSRFTCCRALRTLVLYQLESKMEPAIRTHPSTGLIKPTTIQSSCS
uniref:Immunoglobulin domain-containing protein n=1 Tax=Lates calcarifer TaxID=8187 RepID=A0A4W6FD87_LATCA